MAVAAIPVRTPDGREFDAIEIATCIEWPDDDGGLVVERIDGLEEYQSRTAEHPGLRILWSVYGHLVQGGVSCVADCETRADAQFVGTSIARAHNLPVDDYTFEVAS